MEHDKKAGRGWPTSIISVAVATALLMRGSEARGWLRWAWAWLIATAFLVLVAVGVSLRLRTPALSL